MESIECQQQQQQKYIKKSKIVHCEINKSNDMSDGSFNKNNNNFLSHRVSIWLYINLQNRRKMNLNSWVKKQQNRDYKSIYCENKYDNGFWEIKIKKEEKPTRRWILKNSVKTSEAFVREQFL